MSTPYKPLLAALLVLGPPAGFALGRWTAPDAEAEPMLSALAQQRALLEEHLARDARAPAEGRCILPASGLAAEDMARLRTELAQVLRDELAPRSGAPPVPEANARPPTAEPAAQNLAALQEGHQLIDNATRAQRWTPEDRQTLRRVLGALTPEQRAEVMGRLVTSLQGKKIALSTQGAPF